MIKISFLILYFQFINLTICLWNPHAPLILNKKEDEVFFPTYVNAVDLTVEFPLITYVEPEDESTSTYTFCTISPPSVRSLLGGTLRSENTDRVCQSVDFTREQKLDSAGNPIPCGSYPGYWEYETYFKLLLDDELYYHNSYDYCYDSKNSMSTLYAYYDLKNPSLLKNKYLLGEQNYKFSLKNPAPEDTDILIYYDKQSDYKPYEVAVSEFIPFGHWRNSFYQWHNTAPLNIKLHKPWKTFINNVRSKLAEKIEPIKVFSGIYGVQQSKRSVLYLPDSKITIPMVWWIILYNENKSKGVALIMHNIIINERNEKPMPLCSVEKYYCKEAGLEDVVPQDEYSTKIMIYCCPVPRVVEILQFSNAITPPSEGLLKFFE